MSQPNTLHYLICCEDGDEQQEFVEWMSTNFEPDSYSLYVYSRSINALFTSLNQVFLVRLRWHREMVPF